MSLHAALRKRFPAEEYAVFYEVPNGTGGRASRWADAIVMGLWPSRGLYLHGFEMKTSRSDWLRELKEPAKAEAIAQHCDRWSLLVTDPKIVKDGELPPPWGLWTPRGDTLTCLKEAAPLTPKPIDRLFLAALARSAQKMAQAEIARSAEKQELERKLEEQRVAMEADIERRVDARMKQRDRDLTGLRAAVAAFEQASGLKLDSNEWLAEQLGDAVRRVRELRRLQRSGGIEIARKALRGVLAELDAIEPPLQVEYQSGEK